MAATLVEWDRQFSRAIDNVPGELRGGAGAVLRVLPDRSDWKRFKDTLAREWPRDLRLGLRWRVPHICIVVAYCGVAFYEYDDHTFWRHFEGALDRRLTVPQRTQINEYFESAGDELGLPAAHQDGRGTDYVGTAVRYVGIPLSLWGDFLDVCEWAAWQVGYTNLTNGEWADKMRRLCGGHKRLVGFVCQYRRVAQDVMTEMVKLRNAIRRGRGQVSDVVGRSPLLRPEYFHDVPETAEFLSPENPDALRPDRASLGWDEGRNEIYLRLPAVDGGKLPATWRVSELEKQAGASPGQMAVNGAAFCGQLLLRLGPAGGDPKKPGRVQEQEIEGLAPFGLLADSGFFLPRSRLRVPLGGYTLISKERLQIQSRQGFDQSPECGENEQVELADGSRCFRTRLYPEHGRAELILDLGPGGNRTIEFVLREKLEVQMLAGSGHQAACFERDGGTLVLDHWPLLCLRVPAGYFDDAERSVREGFRVYVGESLASGRWGRPTADEHGRNVFVWQWAEEGGNKPREFSSFAALWEEYFPVQRLSGSQAVSIHAPNFRRELGFRLEKSIPHLAEAWEDLPGAFLPMVLLCQRIGGMAEAELGFAASVVCARQRFNRRSLAAFERAGIIGKSGRTWRIIDSRAVLRRSASGAYLRYCGDPALLWGAYRQVLRCRRAVPPPRVNVVWGREVPAPYLSADWPDSTYDDLLKALEAGNVKIGDSL